MRVFITGASGYIGGSVTAALQTAGHEIIGLARPGTDPHLLRERHIEPVIGTLDDTDLIIAQAQAADAVINAAVVDHRGAVDAFITALRGSGKPFIQTSGSGIIADGAGGELTETVYDDDTSLVVHARRQGRAELVKAVLAATRDGVRSSVIHPSMVYARGTGMNPCSAQIPMMIQAAKNNGAGVYVGAGANRWSNVHIEDLADLYVAVLERGEVGRSYYAENGENSMREIAESISRLLGWGGATKSLSFPEAEAQYGEMMTLLSHGSNSRVRATNARALGWEPSRRPLLDDIERGSYYEDEALT